MEQTDATKAWLDGVTLEVKDVERSLEFYRHVPGVDLEIHHPGEFALLRVGEAHINLLWIGAPGLFFGGTRGFHLEVLTKDLTGLHRQLSQAGIKPLGPPKDRHWGERVFDVIDPDGNHIEFGGR